MSARQWYRFNAKADDKSATVDIYGDIGKSYWDDDAVSAKGFIDDLKALPAGVTALNVRVNSFGGDVFDGIAIANAIRMWGQQDGRTVETSVDGIAASAASIVIQGGHTISIADNAMVMVHHPSTIVWGNAAAMRKMADDLDKITTGLLATYKWHSSLSDDEILALLDGETWMSADEAVEKGFATAKVEGMKATAVLDRRALATMTIPDRFADRVRALVAPEPAKPQPAAAADVLRVCREGGCLELAEALLAEHATLADVQARVSAEKATREAAAAEARTRAEAAAARETEIRALCATAKLPQLADDYVAGGMSVEKVRAQLVTFTALQDKHEIDAGLAPEHQHEQIQSGWKNAFTRVKALTGPRR